MSLSTDSRVINGLGCQIRGRDFLFPICKSALECSAAFVVRIDLRRGRQAPVPAKANRSFFLFLNATMLLKRSLAVFALLLCAAGGEAAMIRTWDVWCYGALILTVGSMWCIVLVH
jgi:hypothetical protein